jgi:hypothetical protein
MAPSDWLNDEMRASDWLIVRVPQRIVHFPKAGQLILASLVVGQGHWGFYEVNC